MKILNIAAGKFNPLYNEEEKKMNNFLINLDTMYYDCNTPENVELECECWSGDSNEVEYINVDAFQFMERTKLIFDKVCIYRFLEHVSFTQIEYFIYLLSTITEEGSEIDIIVPNYAELADMLLNEKIDANFPQHNILLTTELLNEPSCPHASIWTPERARYFFELEGRFRVHSVDPHFRFDGRDIYLRFKAIRYNKV